MAEPIPSILDADALAAAERGQWRLVLRRFLRHRLAVASLVLFLLVIVFAFIGPLVWKWDHLLHREIPSLASPSADHPFGTTRAGNDVLAQVMRGTQQSLKVALTVAVLATGIGSVWGAVAGFYRGWIDTLMMRIVDVIFVIPFLAVAASLSGAVRGGVTWFHIAVILGLVGWMGTARVVRAMVLSVREQEFIEAARAVGASDPRIIFRHLVPNTTGVIIVAATLEVATAILAEAGLSFVGLGIQPPDTSLGLLISSATSAAFTRPWLFYFPGVFIIVICLTVNFIGDGLRDALDPRQTMVRR
ncbi:ABC transporter permease [Phytomonospora endophytica]|uniref:Peptide/nickel transport system permease protein n=1 Tax=Phytomonospora endophytica TaxID=714109 RepID=A0A841FGA8_9ACTN|nr:ABC transporter permease [Phytomonospora endophytica]MBB6032878.1 peptide/nickel transport system permease protein [Phytomonospora endophytica]GIG65104.1 ABC transporter permease [Phytomonospora endophytica]